MSALRTRSGGSSYPSESRRDSVWQPHGTRPRRGDCGGPVLQARAGGPAERFAGRFGGAHPAAVFFAALLCGFAAARRRRRSCSGCSSPTCSSHVGGLGRFDESSVESLVADRTPFLTDVSAVGSAAGGAPVLPILVGLIAIVCARRCAAGGSPAFAVFVLAVESATYRVTSLVVPRDRPTCTGSRTCRPTRATRPATPRPRSRCTPASCCCSRRRSRSAGCASPPGRSPSCCRVFVAMSRMYRGMHHPLDVAGGAAHRASARSLVLLFACRAASARSALARRGAQPARAGRARTAS